MTAEQMREQCRWAARAPKMSPEEQDYINGLDPIARPLAIYQLQVFEYSRLYSLAQFLRDRAR
jgi:hypothetical protein